MIDLAEDLRSISWFAIACCSVVGNICNALHFTNLSIEGISLLFAIFPILQLFACGFLGKKTLCEAMTIDEGNYNDNRVEVLEEPPINVDYFGMLNNFIEEEDYLDTIILQSFVTQRQSSNNNHRNAMMKLPWSVDQGESKSN